MEKRIGWMWFHNLPFNDPSTFTELKWDGIRLIVSNMDELNLYTKNTNATSKYPELHNQPIPKGTILDGEIVVLDEQGKADFEACNAGFRSKRKPVVYMAFDILYHSGVDVTGLPLEVRKGLLERHLGSINYKENRMILCIDEFSGSTIDEGKQFIDDHPENHYYIFGDHSNAPKKS